MTGAEVRTMTSEEIDIEVARLRTEVYKLRTQAITEKVENTGRFAETRRDIARLLTEKSARSKSAGSQAVTK